MLYAQQPLFGLGLGAIRGIHIEQEGIHLAVQGTVFPIRSWKLNLVLIMVASPGNGSRIYLCIRRDAIIRISSGFSVHIVQADRKSLTGKLALVSDHPNQRQRNGSHWDCFVD